MDQFRADLHIHSRHSRATSKSLTPRNLAAWAAVKGIGLLGTGDFTHPEWREELNRELVEDGSGLLRLRDATGLENEIDWIDSPPPAGRLRFMLQAEISSIYKRAGKVRKIHNLVYVPTLEAAESLSKRLEAIGNLASDGRPILGLDSRDLLEMVLETHPHAFLIPAHIWTPWFSLFGSKSGFDSIEECFGDLAPEIFALETGLSSDPDMNWTWSALDRFRLVSNSDAHSGEKLGRELNVFRGERSYECIYRALRGEGLGHKFLGTVEFFPEEGKYHLDGHRKCGVVMEPQETRARGELCPACGKPLTVGVLNRVLELADRAEPVRPGHHPGFTSLVPLSELLAEVLDCGAATKKVRARYAELIRKIGPEMTILQDAPPKEISRVMPALAEAVDRMRQGRVLRNPGFDGQFGVIRVFSPVERKQMKDGHFLSGLQMPAASRQEPAPLPGVRTPEALFHDGGADAGSPSIRLNPSQEHAVAAGPGPMLVLAGPGTGKTRTLISRITRLVGEGEAPSTILAVTFTRRAAEELRERLEAALPKAQPPRAGTLHALAFEHWRDAYTEAPVVIDEEAARKIFAEVNPELRGEELKLAWKRASLARERLEEPEGDDAALAEALLRYTKQKESWNLADYTDLLVFLLEQIESGIYKPPYAHVLVDEIQDLTPLQVRLATRLAPSDGRGFFAIGDPNQSIYGFRGATGGVGEALSREWPDLLAVSLAENYRSVATVLDCAHALVPDSPTLEAHSGGPGGVLLFEAPSAHQEAAWIGEQIRKLIGATSHSLADAGAEGGLSPGDVAVLVRFRALMAPLRRTLERLGLPVGVPEQEPFWHEPRVEAILNAARRFLGMAADEEADALELPEKVLARGPLGLAAYLEDIAPFDRMFWRGRDFRELSRAFEQQGGWVGLMNWIHLRQDLDEVRARAEKIQIMTLHAAKGLEFEAVFLPALEDGILPFAGAGVLAGKGVGHAEIMDTAEERRLFYVGLTRARRFAYLSHAAGRELFGRELRLSRSRFLKELPEDLLKRSTLVARKVRREQHLNLI